MHSALPLTTASLSSHHHTILHLIIYVWVLDRSGPLLTLVSSHSPFSHSHLLHVHCCFLTLELSFWNTSFSFVLLLCTSLFLFLWVCVLLPFLLLLIFSLFSPHSTYFSPRFLFCSFWRSCSHSVFSTYSVHFTLLTAFSALCTTFLSALSLGGSALSFLTWDSSLFSGSPACCVPALTLHTGIPACVSRLHSFHLFSLNFLFFLLSPGFHF